MRRKQAAAQAKISARSKKVIEEIVHETGESQIAIIENAVMAYHRQWRIEQVNKAYLNLREDPRKWKEELDERSVLERTSEDGLEDA
jgi:hypothetical protein